MRRFRTPLLLFVALLAPLPALTGCNIVGAGAVVANRIVPQKTEAQYKGLAGESVGIMVWAERGIRIDWPTVQSDIATNLQNKLLAAQADKSKELKETKFPVPAASILRYQAEYPQIQSRPITEVAPHLANRTGLTRLIYIEVNDFSTRPAPGVALFRGSLSGSIKVLTIKDGKAVAVYEESDVRASFPKKSPEEGSPNLDDNRVYVGTVGEFTTEVVKRFITYEDEE
jgi:hypothetical protein